MGGKRKGSKPGVRRADGIALISLAVHTSPASVDGVRLDRCW